MRLQGPHCGLAYRSAAWVNGAAHRSVTDRHNNRIAVNTRCRCILRRYTSIDGQCLQATGSGAGGDLASRTSPDIRAVDVAIEPVGY